MNLSSLEDFKVWVEGLHPQIGSRGGRYFSDNRGRQFRLSQIVTRLQEIHPKDFKQPLTDKIIGTIRAKTESADDFLSRRSTLIRKLTAIKQTAGKLLYKGEEIDQILTSLEALEFSKSVQVRIQKNRIIAATQGDKEFPKGFKLRHSSMSDPLVIVSIDQTEKKYSIESDARGFAFTCGRRPSMEDRALITEISCKGHQAKLYGVLDGHGGSQVAQFVMKNLSIYMKDELEKQSDLSDEAIWETLKSTFVRLDTDCEGVCEGTTAAVAFTLNGDLWVANVGDSRIILNNNGKSEQLSEDAKPNIDRYKNKIEGNGSQVVDVKGVWRVDGKIAIARTVGDTIYGKSVSPKPKITKIPLKEIKNGYLVIGSDGLFDVATSKEVVDVVERLKEKSTQDIAHLLVQNALLRGSKDNVTALVVKLQ